MGLGPGVSDLLTLNVQTPVPECYAYRAIQTGVNRLFISDEGVSSCDSDDPHKVIVSVTNANEYPIVVDHLTTEIVGEFVKIENRANVVNTGHTYQTTLSSPNSAEEAQLPDEVSTANHSAIHAEMDQRIQNDYQRISRIPIAYQDVCIFYSGLGGCTKRIELCFREYGTSFRIMCVVDADKRMLDLHTRNFPAIPTCLCKIGYSYTRTMNKIALIYPRHRWSGCVILASVECKLGSTANIHLRNLAKFAQQNLFSVRLLKRMKPKAHLIEQVLPGEKSLAAEAPSLQKVDFHDMTGDIACTRERVIASSHGLNFRPYTGRHITLQNILDLTNEQLRGKPCVVVSSLGTLRQTTQPTPTVTSNPLNVGPHITDLKPLTPE
mmetsp:Transcript_31895/g.102036  ORF Transcript_31895/g.102036 Transcript_31895/m.102036 type:complete len:380 (+) Transcript_31895:129-1268(+)